MCVEGEEQDCGVRGGRGCMVGVGTQYGLHVIELGLTVNSRVRVNVT